MPATPTEPAAGAATDRRSRFGPIRKRMYLSAAAGFTGAAIGWLAIQMISDLGPIINSYGVLDLVALAMLGGCIGGSIQGMAALRQEENVARGIGTGLVLGVVAGAVGGLIGLLIVAITRLDNSQAGFIVARFLVWGLSAGALGAAFAAPSFAFNQTRIVEAALVGLAGGLVGASLLSFPGPTQVWQLFGFLGVGAAVGYGTSRSRHPVGVLESAASTEGLLALFRHREWEVWDDRSTAIGRRFRIEAAAGRYRIVAGSGDGAPLQVSGKPVQTEADLRPDDVVRVGEREFRFRLSTGAT